jgi:hypothetical protein
VFYNFTSSGGTCAKSNFAFLYSGIETQHVTAALYYEGGGGVVLQDVSMFCYKVHKWPQPFALR